MVGTLINVGMILAGSCAGISVGSRFPERIREIVLQGLGLLTLLVGMQMALQTKNILIVLGAVLMGGITGEVLRIQDGLEGLGAFFQKKLAGKSPSGHGTHFAEGFVTASLVFCIGPMAILGSIQDGLSGDYRLLAIKSILDGFASIAFSASLGWGVSLSVVSVFLYQGGITLFAELFSRILTDSMIVEMTATGGLIIVGIGLKLLSVKEIRLASFLPALVVAPALVALIPTFKSFFD